MSTAEISWPAPRLSPSGALSLAGEAQGEGPERVRGAFARGPGAGLLHLAVGELSTPLPEPLAFFRELAKRYLTRLCSRPDLDEQVAFAQVEAGPGDLDDLLALAPPFAGAEYLSIDALGGLWLAVEGAAREAAKGHPTVAAFLAAEAPLWNRVGRVSFHLAENRREEGEPFAFMATFSNRVSAHGAVQHLPLLRALELYGASGDKQKLLRLLSPLDRAAKASPQVARLVESNAVYRPLALSASEAYALLREVPEIEAAGVQVRVPDWWKARPRPVVKAEVGSKAPAGINAQALLGFSITVALGDQALTRAELAQLMASEGGLVRLRGQWVEVNKEQLAQALSHWKEVEKMASDGLSFSEGMRLLLGFERGGLGETPAEVRSWTRVEAGPWLAGVLERMRDPAHALSERLALSELKARLRPYQEVGVRWLRALGALGLGACLADDMGLGKTLQVIGAMLLRTRATPGEVHLVVAPSSLLANWGAELARFAPSLRVQVAHASAARGQQAGGELAEVDVVLTSYGMLSRLPWLAQRRWGMVVLDEAQAIKNPGSRQSKLARALDGAARVVVTGTPVENRLSDLWSLFDFANPGLLGTARSFASFTKESQRSGGSLRRLRGLVRPYLLRRLKSDPAVAPDLPPKTEVPVFCLLSKRQGALYQAEVESLREVLNGGADGIRRKGAVLASMLRLKQICNHPSLFAGDGGFEPDDSGKLERLAALADEIAQRQERALVFTQFREFTAPLVAFLSTIFGAPGLCLHGGTPVPQRKKLVDAFQRDDGPPFFVISLKAGGVGLNLTAASHVIHVDRWWNPAVEDQATDRAHRIGQRRHVLVHKMMCQGTLDEHIDALIRAKKGLASDLIEGPPETLLTELSNDEILSLVRLDLGAVAE